MNNISANTLFHFTNSLQSIINILTNNFTPRYCMEKYDFLSNDESSLEFAVPMTCFCDIPLSQINNHVEYYGGYAIGLSKEWGIDKRINPVMYSQPQAFATLIYKEFMENLDKAEKVLDSIVNDVKVSKKTSSKVSEALISVKEAGALHFYFTNYMKSYKGLPWKNDSFSGELVNFYNECEWRYVPNPYELSDNGILSYLSKEQFLDITYKNAMNKKLGEVIRLAFTPNDIKYIVVNSENEILNMCDQIDIIQGDKYSQNDLKLLKTRIISKEQILQDF